VGSILKIENLHYKNILNGLNLSIKEKTFNILVGSNGSGKTTLVNCIRGLLKYKGRIELDALLTQTNIGYFMNDEIMIPNNLFDELLNHLANLDYDFETAKKKIYELAKKLDIISLLYKKKEELRTFEYTLISFVFSVITDPKFLIIDNNLETLDEYYKNKIINYIKGLKKITILFVTNNSEYFYMCDNILIIKDGIIFEEFDMKDIIKHEKQLIKNGSNLPFNIDLSNKLMSYELLKKEEKDLDKMVDKIWS